MKIKSALVVLAFIISFLAVGQKTYTYQSVPNDPMNTRIYTLDNGLKVYLSVYKDAPRIQTAIAVRTGSKNDPHDNTGLSHYLEHMMFKGTDKFGSRDFSKEGPELAKIDSLFELYRSFTDTNKRKAIYHVIDSVSGVAAKLAIANEYDKMLNVMGAKGTNAFTSVEQTVYINDIPANQFETWLMVEAERFRNPTFRIFHTELEAVYEEKNMSLDSDDDKVWELLFAELFPKHTYGTQTTIGTIDHLKNPSLKALKAYFKARYVPNNMAICLSGDFNPDQVMALIDKAWSPYQPKPLNDYVVPVENPITKPIEKSVLGPDAASLTMAFRFGGKSIVDADYLSLINMILNNGSAGLIDLNLVQGQKVLEASSFNYSMKDYSTLILQAKPKEGQTLEETRDLLLGQIELLKKGDYPDWLLTAIINDMKLSEVKRDESNMSRDMTMVDAFVNNEPWDRYVKEIDRLSKITKQDIMAFARKNFNNNYVAIYKRTGTDPDVKKVSKPSITPVEVNREETSAFVKEISSRKPLDIQPVFIDYEKDIQTLQLTKDIPVLYRQNAENKTFDLYYEFDMGTNHDQKLGIALDYLKFLGTSKYSPAEFQQELYKAGCSMNVSTGNDQVWVSLSGLSENFARGLELFESLATDPKGNDEALNNMVGDILKQRGDDKLNKGTILWSAMYNYGQFGKVSPFTNILSESELKALKPADLLNVVKNLESYPHRVLYYGTLPGNDLIKALKAGHKANVTRALPVEKKFVELENSGNNVYVVDYDMKQVEIIMMSKSQKYDPATIPAIRIFNEYFGGSMASIVFQELREARALAYSAYGGYRSPSRPDRNNTLFAYIGTQNDKLPEAMKSMLGLFNNMPESPKSFQDAKNGVLNKIRTERITKARILFNYENARRFGLTHDIRKDVYEQVPGMDFASLRAFADKNLKNKNYNILVLGKKDKLDIKELEKYGPVKYLTLQDVFAY